MAEDRIPGGCLVRAVSRTAVLVLGLAGPALTDVASGQEVRPELLEGLRVRTLAPAALLPGSEIPILALDTAATYHVFAGLGASGSWRLPSDLPGTGRIPLFEWIEVGTGDGYAVLPDPQDPRYAYAASSGGRLVRFDLLTGERRNVRPWEPDTVALRYGTRPPLVADPFFPGTLYFASQFLHRSTDQGKSWQIVSGDLTGGAPGRRRGEEDGAGGVAAVIAVAPSPLEREVIWLGTGDGRLHLTRSGGGAWEDVPVRIRGLTGGAPVLHIEPSHHVPGRAYVVFGDTGTAESEPLLYRTDRYGRDWTRLVEGNDIAGPVHTIREDPTVPGLLFVGGGGGLYGSFDGGDRWTRLSLGLPDLPVHSLALHPRNLDLVVGTEGGGIFVLEDLRPLQALAREPSLLTAAVTLFPPPPALLEGPGLRRGPGSSEGQPAGEGRSPGALLTFWIGVEEPAPEAVVEVRDLYGELVRTLPVRPRPGMNRITWDLRADRPATSGSDGELPPAPEVLPEGHEVTVRVNGAASSQSLQVLPDPAEDLPLRDRIARVRAQRTAVELVVFVAEIRSRGAELRAARQRLESLPAAEGEMASEAVRHLAELGGGLDLLDARLEALAGDLEILRAMGESRGPPTETERIALFRVGEGSEEAAASLNTLLVGTVARLRESLGPERRGMVPDLQVVVRPSGEGEGRHP